MKIVEAIKDSIYSDLQSREVLFKESLDNFSVKRMAEIISGTSDKSSKAYKSAERQVYLYKQGKRNPGKATQAKLRNAVEEKRRSKVRSLTVKISGIFRKSSDRRQRSIEVLVDPNDYLDLNEKEAMDQLMYDYGVSDAYFDDYKVTI